MNAQFRQEKNIARDRVDWGEQRWLSRPADNQAKQITQIVLELQPGFGHNFHHHPRQEETIYVMEGEVEQWLEKEKRILRAGEAVFIGAGVVHASFNLSPRAAKLMVVLSPCVGDGGYEVVDVANQAPWNALRKGTGKA
jgi:quercetin dioxygenase-like cupin family protein